MTDYQITLYNSEFGSFTLPDKDEPIGWADMQFVMRRHKTYHGIFPEISISLQWICTGKSFIDHCYKTFGIDVDIEVKITAITQTGSIPVYHGKLDLTTAKWTVDYVECEIKPYTCVDLFMNRVSVPVNLYDEACYTELTYDKTAYRTRYRFAPYRLLVRESPGGTSVTGRSDFVLKKPVVCGVEQDSVIIGNKFSLDGGIGCNLIICDIAPNDCSNNVTLPCVGSSACDNNISNIFVDPDPAGLLFPPAKCNSPSGARDFYFYPIINGVPLSVTTDDLEIFDTGYSPQNGASQFHRNCGNEIEDEEENYDPEFEYNAEAQCSCCGETYDGEPNPCPTEDMTALPAICTGYKVTISAELTVSFCLDIVEGEVEFVRFSPELVFQWGDFEYIIDSASGLLFDNSCAGWDNTCTGNPNCTNPACGDVIWQSIKEDIEITIPPCTVKSLDKMRIISRTKLGFHAGANLLTSSDLSIIVNTEWHSLSGTIETADCLPGMSKIGDSKPYVYAIHESLSRVVEHYTNNCLRVKSNFFGRPNSMEWAEDCEVQNTDGCFPASYDSCCDADVEWGPSVFSATATASFTPPDFPPPSESDYFTGNVSGANLLTNNCGLTVQSGECIVFPTAGTYTITAATFNIDLTGSIVSWVNTDEYALASANVKFYLKIGAYVLNILDQTIDTLVPDTDCNTDSVSMVAAPAITLPFIFNVTPAMITANTNKLCAIVELSAEVFSFSFCPTNPDFASVSAQAQINVLSGLISISQPGCSYSSGPAAPGSMATSNCDCNNPEAFPVCNETFDPVPFQIAEPHCYAYMALTSGISLRQFGTECFVTFQDLFQSLNALFNIGVGFTENDPNVLRIESWDYFYNETVILSFEVDLYQAKYVRKVENEMYYNQFEFGYNSWLNEKTSTLYEFNTKRVYSLPVKHVEKALTQVSKYIASPYAIEKQRRDILNNNAEYDNEIFFICVGPSVDTTNTAQVTDGTDTVTYPSHMWITEHGISYAQNMPDWKWPLNYRIAPFRCHFVHWEPTVNVGLWHTNGTLEFVKGDANYKICGTDPAHNNFNCSIGFTCENQSMPAYGNSINNDRRLFPETVTVNLPLTVGDWRVIKMNPYGQIAINDELFYINEVKFKINADSELTLIRASRNNPTGP